MKRERHALLLLMLTFLLTAAPAHAGQLYAETQTEIQWESGQLVAAVRQVIEWAEESWSIWLITEGRQSLNSTEPVQFGYDLAYMRAFGSGAVTIGYHNTAHGEDLIYIQYAHPW